ncbi:MAG: helicase-related protein [Myxococcota bacterium]
MGRRRGGRSPRGKGRGRGRGRNPGGKPGGGPPGPKKGRGGRRPPRKREPLPEPPPLPEPGPGPTREELDRATRALPIYQYEDEIVRTIRDHRVVVVEGPTGSGKTTQLPRMLLRAGIGAPDILGVTQPRRIAAVSVAWRIAEEEGVDLGREVGYAIRFDDVTSADTKLKIMTDGLLLQEAHSDADFSAYGVVMVDEAHERSLNIDFTLGLLHRALSRRDDLKVIVSSATLRPELFQEYFRSVAGDVPLLHIESSTHPVKVRYRPPPSEHPDEVAEATASEIAQIHRRGDPGHVLAFLTGEGMIRHTEAQLLNRGLGRKDMVILPLFGRLTREEQERIFLEWPGRRKVVLATNIAETSITIPDVRHIVDTGLAKVPRVNPRTGITALHAEGVSQASAAQRAGRAGRTAPGEAIRLYAKHDLEHRPEYTDEEILRLDLTSVVLRLIDLGIHDVEDFPFPTPPPRRRLKAALRSLKSMNAIDGHRRLTDIGRRMVPFPADPPLARMIVEAADRFPDAVDDVLVVAAFLSGRPPYLFPAGEEQEARDAQERLAHPLGDHTTAVQTYRRWLDARDRESFCEAHYLDPNIMEFMAKAHEQFADIAETLGITVGRGADPEAVVRCVAAGFADRVMASKGRDFEGPGGVAVGLHPGSVLFGERHRFIVATEIVDTRRPWARAASVLRPEWIERIDPDLARSLGIRRRKAGRKPKVDLSRVPSAVRVGKVALPVTIVRGEPRLEIRVEQVPDLLDADPSSVSDAQLSFRSRIAAGHHHFAQGWPLGVILALLPYMPLPAPGAHLDRDVPQGILMEADRNLHELGRWFDRILTPSLPHKGKRPGWLTLVANGAGGYWFEVLTSFKDALEATSDALEDLADHLPDADPLQERLAEVRPKVDDAVSGMHHALGSLPRGVK